MQPLARSRRQKIELPPVRALALAKCYAQRARSSLREKLVQ